MIKNFKEFIIEEGALPSERSIQQLNQVKKMSVKTDIGNKVKTSNRDKSALTNVESYEDFIKGNKNFNANWNNTGQEPYKKKRKKK